MTKKEINQKLKEFGFKETNFDGELCAYAQLRDNLKDNHIPLKDITDLSLTDEGELVAEFETGLGYSSGYLLEYDDPNYWDNPRQRILRGE